jgi:hypothetical protein
MLVVQPPRPGHGMSAFTSFPRRPAVLARARRVENDRLIIDLARYLSTLAQYLAPVRASAWILHSHYCALLAGYQARRGRASDQSAMSL